MVKVKVQLPIMSTEFVTKNTSRTSVVIWIIKHGHWPTKGVWNLYTTVAGIL